jgi:hypothetical protein
MKKAKQKRLAAGGWRVGTPAEFLKLDDIESQVVEIKLSPQRGAAHSSWAAPLDADPAR